MRSFFLAPFLLLALTVLSVATVGVDASNIRLGVDRWRMQQRSKGFEGHDGVLQMRLLQLTATVLIA